MHWRSSKVSDLGGGHCWSLDRLVGGLLEYTRDGLSFIKLLIVLLKIRVQREKKINTSNRVPFSH